MKTAKEDQDRILSIIINADRVGIEEVDFKASSGWTKVSILALKRLANLLTFFVQFCFAEEKRHHDIIDSLTTVAEIVNYDYLNGWQYPLTSNNNRVVISYSQNIQELMIILYSHFIFATLDESYNICVSEDSLVLAQQLIDKKYYQMPNLTPTQFYFAC